MNKNKSKRNADFLACLVVMVSSLLFLGCKEDRPPQGFGDDIDRTVVLTPLDRPTSSGATKEFAIHWPPQDPSLKDEEANKDNGEISETPLLRGEISVTQTKQDLAYGAFRLHLTITRPGGESDRVRWNETLAFPEYDWMSKVRVWDESEKWLWPNLPYLLRAHGKERVHRYGGVDPGKGVDNDFAAVLIRKLGNAEMGDDGLEKPEPLVSAEWYPVGAEGRNKEEIVHGARSDEFRIQPALGDQPSDTHKLGLWLIYADFLDSPIPRSWPQEEEYAGGVLAYSEISWQRIDRGMMKFQIECGSPPSGTGFDWEEWSTGEEPLKKRLTLSLESSN